MGSLKRRLALGITTLIAGTVLVAIPPTNAGATATGLTVSVGTIVNLSQETGNQFEGSVAIDPSNPSRMFVLARDETGNLIGARSSDGGSTWTHSKMGTCVCSADKLPPAWGNTSVTFDQYGNLFVAYLSTSTSTYTDFALSTDGGATFSHQLALAKLTDQPVVAAGHGSVWVTYNQGGVNAVVGASVTGLGAIGTFGTPEAVPGANASSFGDMSIGPQGQVMVAFGPNGSTGGVVVSVDPDGLGPLGFTTATEVAPTNVPGFDHIAAAPNWGVDSEAHLAWDQSGGPHDGRVYLAYLDCPAADLNNTMLYVMHSDDGGVTWSSPVLVNDDGTAASHFMPGFAVDQTTGAVGATWYDTRGDSTRVNAAYYGSVSVDGGDTWSANFPISAGTSNATYATPPGSIRNTNYGDYTGLAFHGGVMVPIWADNSNSTGNNPAGANSSFDLYTALVQVTMPTIASAVTAQPAPTTVTTGSTYSFTAAGSGAPAPTVQWQRSNDGGTTFADIAGATSGPYSATASITDTGAQFRAVFTNSAGSATTTAATLTVTTTTTVVLSVAHVTLKTGKNDTVTVIVTSPVTGSKKVPGGTITVFDGSTTVASVQVAKGKGKVVLIFTKGVHVLRAVYAGSGTVLAGQSALLTVTAT